MLYRAENVVLDTQADVLLRASAGTGKTYNLTRRIMHIVCEDRVPIDEVLVLTFTDAAASEMREKIYHRLLELADEATEPGLKAFLAEQKARFGRNAIGTMHAFAARVLRQSADVLSGLRETAVPQGFWVPEALQDAGDASWSENARQIDTYLQSRLETAWRKDFLRMYRDLPALIRILDVAGRTDGFFGYLDSVSGIADAQLAAMACLDQPRYREWLAEAHARLADKAEAHWERARRVMLEYADLLKSPVPKTCEDLFKASSVWFTKTGFSKKMLAKMDDKDEREQIAVKLDKVFKALIPYLSLQKKFEVADVAFRGGALPEEALVEFQVYENFRALGELALRWKCYTRWRRARDGWMNFDDLIRLAHHLITTSPDVCGRLQRRFRHILVDEFQDTDRQQWELIRAIRGEGNGRRLFMVGDMKQAIYGFRGGNVGLIRSVEDASADGSGLPLQVASLPVSYRSLAEIVAFVNAQFDRVMRPIHEERNFQADYEALEANHWEGNPRGTVAVWKFEKPNSADVPAGDDAIRDSVKSFSELGPKMVDAYAIAAFLRALKDDATGSRYPQYRDIAEKMRTNEKAVGILVRTGGNVEHLNTALRLFGLTATTTGGSGFFARQEISDLFYLLRFLSDAWDDMALAAVLRSPFFSVSDVGLLALANTVRSASYRKPWWYALAEDDLGDLLPPDQVSLDMAKTMLAEWRLRVRSERIATILELAISETPFLAGFADTDAARENVYKLTGLIRQQEENGDGGLRSIVEWLETQRESTRDAEAPVPDTGSIHIMTMHKSKGLQFPMVILSNMNMASKGGSGSGLTVTPIDLHDQMLPLVALEGGPDNEDADDESFLKTYLKVLIAERERAEELRLYYVAATRAERHLILNDTSGIGGALRTTPFVQALRQVLPYDGVESIEIGYPTYKSLMLEILERGKRSTTDSTENILPVRIDSPALQRALSQASVPVTYPSGGEHEAQTRAEHALWEAVSPADAGTLIHLLLRYGDRDRATAQRRLAMEAEGLDYAVGSPGVDVDLSRILEHAERAGRLLRERFPHPVNMYREHPFEVFTGEAWVRGTADLLIQDQDGLWHLIDFKTARVADENIRSWAKASGYGTQLQAYREAVALATQGQVQIPETQAWLLLTGSENGNWISLADIKNQV